MYIYYDSKTGNVERFINKLKKERPNWDFIKIDSNMIIDKKGHFITYTTKIGEVSDNSRKFLNNGNNSAFIISVSSSGNMNWGTFFALAADKINKEYNIPIGMKFELSGTQIQVNDYIKYIEERE